MNRDLSLEELERDPWSVPSGGETRLMATVRHLRRDRRRRGMRDAELVIRDSVMGLWRALAEVDRSHGCRGAGFTGNVIHGLPKSAQPGAT